MKNDSRGLTFSFGELRFSKSTKALCPRHGIVPGDFNCYVTNEPTFTTPKICPKCFVEWVAANVTPVTPLPPGVTPEQVEH